MSPTGWLEVICGCMFSGKTEELIRQIRRAELAKQRVQLFKPQIDNRYSISEVASHSKIRVPAMVILHAEEMLSLVNRDVKVVGIDEAQFFSEAIVDVAQELVRRKHRVIVAGLDTDWLGKPFGSMPNLLAVADVIRKQYAICTVCGELATRSQRLPAAGLKSTDTILVGAEDSYEARCRQHFDADFSFPKSFQSNQKPLANEASMNEK